MIHAHTSRSQFLSRTLATATLSLALLAGSATAGLSDVYVFNTTTGVITFNGVNTTTFNGVAVTNVGVSSSQRTWRMTGDFTVPNNTIVRFRGTNLARVLIGGDMVIPSGSSIDADASGSTPGPGGGSAGSGNSGGIATTGGNGGASTTATGPNGNNGAAAVNQNGGNGGSAPRAGGAGADGDTGTGAAGGTGANRVSGSAGPAGDTGNAGASGGAGVFNFLPVSPGGAGGSAGSGATILFVTGGGGAGGSGSTGLADPPGVGGTGLAGSNGLGGGDAGPGGPGSNGGFYSPGAALIAVLNGGNGGGGGGGGGSGGGGAGGSSGGGGGGGGSGSGFLFNAGGGGGGGGAGAGGGRGGTGGSGGAGGIGGGGAGGIQFVVQGKIYNQGNITAIGGNGTLAFSGTPGTVGFQGGTGGTFGAGGNGQVDGARGGSGGGGGDGGAGGDGGGGGRGGGGAGGTLFFAATAMLDIATANVDVRGGIGASVAASGRLLLGDAVSTSPVLNASPAPSLISRSLDFVPTATNIYFGDVITPNIVSDDTDPQGLVQLLGGPGPFGILPGTLAERGITTALGTIPPRARAAVVRYIFGPTGFAVRYNVTSVSSGTNTFDMFVFVNLSGADQPTALFNGVPIARFPAARRTDFGGSNSPEFLPTLPSGRAWAVLGPEETSVNLNMTFGSLNRSLTLDDATGGPQVAFIIEPCGPADLGGEGGSLVPDGILDNNDFIVFINLFFDTDPAADVGSQGGAAGSDGIFDNNDFIVFIQAFFGGC